jgi:hypothetical protein
VITKGFEKVEHRWYRLEVDLVDKKQTKEFEKVV